VVDQVEQVFANFCLASDSAPQAAVLAVAAKYMYRLRLADLEGRARGFSRSAGPSTARGVDGSTRGAQARRPGLRRGWLPPAGAPAPRLRWGPP